MPDLADIYRNPWFLAYLGFFWLRYFGYFAFAYRYLRETNVAPILTPLVTARFE